MATNYQLAFEERTSWLQTENIWTSRQHRNNLWSPAAREPLQMSELNSKPQLRQIYHKDWAARSHEMEKISLHSPKKSCGTGFFLPRTVAADFQLTNKSNMRSSQSWNSNVTRNKKSQRSVANKTSSSSHYIYLPKEWTY
ncbi:hypothetical protein POM88_029210 [Heracleum sosnowskyi]|uniref:Uncharacterized protein n=1 Tax=Heracleum sosnowskyi TaxID=360622 RepID=A0AAD8HV05_9APIA|nr:hypothetical protein POM88_029210 [Heracleum sosnowskyi]